MSYQRDYILRIIEEFFKFLGQILKLKSGKQYEQALKLIDEAAQSFVKVDLNEMMNNENMLNEILKNKQLSIDHLQILAELLKVKADIYQETNLLFSAASHYQYSLAIYEQVLNESKNYSIDVANKIDEIRNILLSLQ